MFAQNIFKFVKKFFSRVPRNSFLFAFLEKPFYLENTKTTKSMKRKIKFFAQFKINMIL